MRRAIDALRHAWHTIRMALHDPDPAFQALNAHPHLLLAALLKGECRGESITGQIAVACTVRNRVRALNVPNAEHPWSLVILRWAQYSCLWPSLGGSANFAVTKSFATDLLLPSYQPSAQEKQLLWVAEGVVFGAIQDITFGATHYYSTIIPPPAWTDPPAYVTNRLGKHVFYAGVA